MKEWPMVNLPPSPNLWAIGVIVGTYLLANAYFCLRLANIIG